MQYVMLSVFVVGFMRISRPSLSFFYHFPILWFVIFAFNYLFMIIGETYMASNDLTSSVVAFLWSKKAHVISGRLYGEAEYWKHMQYHEGFARK